VDKNPRSSERGFFICVRRTQHHLTEGQHHFEQRENIVSHFTAQMNEVALRANEDAASRKRCDASHQ